MSRSLRDERRAWSDLAAGQYGEIEKRGICQEPPHRAAILTGRDAAYSDRRFRAGAEDADCIVDNARDILATVVAARRR